MLSFPVRYAHCFRNDGGPDRYPHTQYISCAVDATMYRIPGDYRCLGADPDTFECRGGGLSGYGDDKSEAIHDLQWRLMNRSRQEALVSVLA